MRELWIKCNSYTRTSNLLLQIGREGKLLTYIQEQVCFSNSNNLLIIHSDVQHLKQARTNKENVLLWVYVIATLTYQTQTRAKLIK